MAQAPHPTPCLGPNHVSLLISVTIRVIDTTTIIEDEGCGVSQGRKSARGTAQH